jgi:hypothetical protein
MANHHSHNIGDWVDSFIHFLVGNFALIILCACSPFSVPEAPQQSESVVYQVERIENNLIQFIWLEVPEPLEPGEADLRIFLARTNPPQPVIPNPGPLACTLENEAAFADLTPEIITFQFSPDNSFTGSYTFPACPECVECYMNWDYTFEFSGEIHAESAMLDIAVKHIGLNVQGSYLSVEMERLTAPSREPRIQCRGDGTCTEMIFVDRDG